jgi:hypothetical protein
VIIMKIWTTIGVFEDNKRSKMLPSEACIWDKRELRSKAASAANTHDKSRQAAQPLALMGLKLKGILILETNQNYTF